MLRSVLESSIETYHGEIVGNKEFHQKQKVLDYIQSKGRVTGRMIARHLEMETGTVSARVNSLVKEGLAFRELSLNPCPVSFRNVHWIYSKPQQGVLL